MNHASFAPWVVPVLPAISRPSNWARLPVPWLTTFSIIHVSCRAELSWMTRSSIPPPVPINGSLSPSRLSSTKPNGVTADPPFRMPAYAPVISNNVLSDAPNARAGPAAKSLLIPKSEATRRTKSRPTLSEILTAGMFNDASSARAIVTGPSNFLV